MTLSTSNPPVTLSSDIIGSAEAVPVRPAPGCQIHLLATCLCDAFYPGAAMAAAECIEAVAGFRVVFDERQTCCGQPAFNSGDWQAARMVARHTLKVFRGAKCVVVPSGSCAAMIRRMYPRLFEGEPDCEEARALAARTWEFTEFLVRGAGIERWPGRCKRTVAYHRSCHTRELGAGALAENLLRTIDGLDLREIPAPEQCCGFGGTFAVAFPWTSREIGRAKLEAFAAAGAHEIISGDMGCLMHLDGLRRRMAKDGEGEGEWGSKPGRKEALTMPFRHIAEVLCESWQNRKGESAK